MLLPMDLEEKRETKQTRKQQIAAEAALKAKTSDQFVPTPSASTSSPSALTGSASYTPGVAQNRAEKYLPSGHLLTGYGQKAHELTL